MAAVDSCYPVHVFIFVFGGAKANVHRTTMSAFFFGILYSAVN
jgi:hypothetical protein